MERIKPLLWSLEDESIRLTFNKEGNNYNIMGYPVTSNDPPLGETTMNLHRTIKNRCPMKSIILTTREELEEILVEDCAIQRRIGPNSNAFDKPHEDPILSMAKPWRVEVVQEHSVRLYLPRDCAALPRKTVALS